MKYLLVVLLSLILSTAAWADNTDYRQYFRVDLEEPLPSLAELSQKYKTALQLFLEYRQSL